MIAPALEALKAHRQFILYRLSPSQTRPGKTDKFPCDASGRVVSAHDPANWMSADSAGRFVQQFGAGYGIGFVLTPDARRFCLDIDNCLQPDGQWSPLALQLCAMFPGAAIEVSASGCGLHIWGSYTGDMPLHGCKNEALGIELYTDKRFIALGRPEGTTGNVATDCTMAVHSAIALYFPPDAAQALAQEWTTARPQLRTVGNAITSRIKIVPFKASFLGREDGDLPRRLRENLGYVLAWLIEGHGKWLAAGKRLPPCQAVESESADYFAAQSTPEMWLAERVQILAPDVRPASPYQIT